MESSSLPLYPGLNLVLDCTNIICSMIISSPCMSEIKPIVIAKEILKSLRYYIDVYHPLTYNEFQDKCNKLAQKLVDGCLTVDDISILGKEFYDIHSLYNIQSMCIKYCKYFHILVDHLDDTSKNPNVVDFMSKMSEIQNRIKKIIDSFMKGNGYSWNGYFGYVNVEHPLYLAYIGKLDLSPETFKYIPGNQITPIETFTKVGDVEYGLERDKALSRTTYNTSGYRCVGHGWNKPQLIEAISKLAQKKAEEKCVDVKEVLSLKLFTGVDEHSVNPLPGFACVKYYNDDFKIPVYNMDRFSRVNRCRIDLHKNSGTKSYYNACYKALTEEKK